MNTHLTWCVCVCSCQHLADVDKAPFTIKHQTIFLEGRKGNKLKILSS